MNFVDWIVISGARADVAAVDPGVATVPAHPIRLEQRPHERACWSMRSLIYDGPLGTAYVLVDFVQNVLTLRSVRR